MVKKFFAITVGLLLPLFAVAGGGHSGVELHKANNDLRDQASLRRGAIAFSDYCMACHTLKYIRYNRIARDLSWTDEEVVAKMAKGLSKPVDPVMARGDLKAIHQVLGTTPPDLSLVARLKGSDYIYSFLLGYFEKDPKKGVWDNHYLPGTAMPNVLEDKYRFAKVDEREALARDLTNFLEYVGEPIKVKRWDLGWKVLLFLFIFFIITYLLKKEYWRDVK
ncbi:ubiquinol-cytochrome c reductase cytochrome c1 subunit [Sulfurivirga caldicuralii]|uniref:Ubiquinol-cytochrome c reductase cytochrome c1 subunit n=1 Tax=Sulfurivirga caldicuralii TaxID=364032 RepID=A0A1N6G2M7_9GAMM|nr:cytochrome c1 [Sulfurivirga caldicuralii]SIO01701.1 ubiquinol-cytochrome c reductase cytochrome c1 subunit [Sulfurivirga caldicuralii]